MTEYKTIAGPIGLRAETGEAYETAVKRYAAIIDAEAVGGWELNCIQQIPVAKSKINISALLNLAMIGAIIGFVVTGGGFRSNPMVGVIMGALAGGGLGAIVCRSDVIEFFNMLVFSKKQ